MKKKKKFDLSLDNAPKEDMKYCLEVLKKKTSAEAEEIFGGEKIVESSQKVNETEPNFFGTPSVLCCCELNLFISIGLLTPTLKKMIPLRR